MNNIVYRISAIDLLSPALRNINRETDNADKGMSDFGKTISAVLSVAAVTQFAASVVSAGSKVEDARVGLTTLLGDAGAANVVIQRTMEDAAKTPFDFEGLLKANKALISAGVSANNARADILALGNAVAATGGGNDELNRMTQNLQQIKNVGKASAADIKQFGFAGINIMKLISQSTGKSIAELDKIPVTYEMITNALAVASGPGGAFEGALKNMEGNVSTMLSGIKDGFFQLAVNIFNALSPALKPILTGLKDILAVLTEFTQTTEGLMLIQSIFFGLVAATAAWAATWVVLNANIIIATASTWLLFAAENAALLGIPALIALIVAGFTFFTNKVGGLTNAFKILEKAAKFTLDAIIAPFKFLHDIATTGSVSKAFTNLKNTFTNDLTDIVKTYDKAVKETEAKTKKTKEAQAKTDAALAKGDKSIVPVTKGPKVKKVTSGVSGPKITTINISMENLVHTFIVQPNNMKDSATQAKDFFTKMLGQAVSDSQLIVR